MKTEIDNAELVADYQGGSSLNKLSIKYGITPKAIRKRLVKAGVYVPYNSPEPVEFWCRTCGAHVVTMPETGDHRTVFCCVQCEKKYWRDATRHNKGIRYINIKRHS